MRFLFTVSPGGDKPIACISPEVALLQHRWVPPVYPPFYPQAIQPPANFASRRGKTIFLRSNGRAKATDLTFSRADVNGRFLMAKAGRQWSF